MMNGTNAAKMPANFQRLFKVEKAPMTDCLVCLPSAVSSRSSEMPNVNARMK